MNAVRVYFPSRAITCVRATAVIASVGLLLSVPVVTISMASTAAKENAAEQQGSPSRLHSPDAHGPQAPVVGADASRFGAILMLEEECNSPAYMSQALDHLGLPHRLVSAWRDFDTILTNGTEWGLVLVNSYGNSADTSVLTKVNTYLAGGGFVIWSYWALNAGTATHPLYQTFGITYGSSFGVPINFTPRDTLHPIFNDPNRVRTFPWTDDQCGTDGQLVTAQPGAQRLAAFVTDLNSGAIVRSPNGRALFNAYMPGNFMGDDNQNGKPDVVELLENQIVYLASSNLDHVTAVYTGARLDTVPSTGHTVKVAYFGSAGAVSGQFLYRPLGFTSYSVGTMSAGTGDTLLFNIPSALLDARGLEYFFRVSRGGTTAFVGSSDAPYEFVVEFAPGMQAMRPDALPDGLYRIVGVPVDITGSTNVQAVFGDDLGDADGGRQWRLFGYSASGDSVVEYPNAANVTPSRAYWLAGRGARRYGTIGFSRQPNDTVNSLPYYRVALSAGWNFLANPVPLDVAWDDVLVEYNGAYFATHPDSLIRDSAYQWFGSYVTQSGQPNIGRWGGLFLEARRTGVFLLFPYASAGAASARAVPDAAPAPSAHYWTLRLTLVAGELSDDGVFVGVRPDAEPGLDRYDFGKPPPAPEGVRLALRLTDGQDTRPYRTDYRPPAADGHTWNLEFSPAFDRRIAVSGVDNLPSGSEVALVLDGGVVVPVWNDESIVLPNDARSARLVVGTSGYAAQQIDGVLPDTYELFQNFPNPFNPQTSIRFALPEAGDVKLSVFNVLGQRVRLLADGHYGAGMHDLTWDGTDAEGRSLASGVYFYRLETGATPIQKKMLLMK